MIALYVLCSTHGPRARGVERTKVNRRLGDRTGLRPVGRVDSQFLLPASPASASQGRCQPVNKAINESISRFDPFRSKEPGLNYLTEQGSWLPEELAHCRSSGASKGSTCSTCSAVHDGPMYCYSGAPSSELAFLSHWPLSAMSASSIMQSIRQNQNQNLSCLNVPESLRCRVVKGL